jgi:hypothetical protein
MEFFRGLIYLFIFLLLPSRPIHAWTDFHSLGHQKIGGQLNFSYRFDQHGGFWSEVCLAYGIGQKTDLFAQLGLVRPVESNHGTLGYGVGVKWEVISQKEVTPDLSFIANYRAARPDNLILNWVDLIMEASFFQSDWEYYLILGVTIPKDDNSSILLGGGVVVPLTEFPGASFLLGVRFNTGTDKQDAYFTFDSGVSFLF